MGRIGSRFLLILVGRAGTGRKFLEIFKLMLSDFLYRVLADFPWHCALICTAAYICQYSSKFICIDSIVALTPLLETILNSNSWLNYIYRGLMMLDVGDLKTTLVDHSYGELNRPIYRHSALPKISQYRYQTNRFGIILIGIGFCMRWWESLNKVNI